MDKILFERILSGEITSKNYKKKKITKSQFYKVYSRVNFYKKITNPIKFCILNLSQREFLAVKNSMLKSDYFRKSKSKSFPHPIENSSNEGDD